MSGNVLLSCRRVLKKGVVYQALRYAENGGFDFKTAVLQWSIFLWHNEPPPNNGFFLFPLARRVFLSYFGVVDFGPSCSANICTTLTIAF